MVSENYRVPSQILKALAHPARLCLLNALRDGEQCVCHLTALLDHRQAYVSQQLMFLRQAGLIEDRKEGLNIYYRVKDPRLFEIVDAVSTLAGTRKTKAEVRKLKCTCPKCTC